MTGGKKNKKKKGIKISLVDFLNQDGSTAIPGEGNLVHKQLPTFNEDGQEDMVARENMTLVLPSCPRTARGPLVDESKIPTDAPFTAHVANLPFESSEPEIRSFFRDMNILEITLPMAGDGTRFKGYGYVVFETRLELIEALNMDEEMMRNRKIRVDLPDSEQDSRGGRDGEGGHRRRMGGFERGGDEMEDRSGNDDHWRSSRGPALPKPEGGSKYGGGGGSRYDDDTRGSGPSRADDEPWRSETSAKGYGGDSFGDRRAGSTFDGRRDGRQQGGGGYDDRRSGGYDDRRSGGGFVDRSGGGGGGGYDGRGYGSRSGGGSRYGADEGSPKERTRLQLKPRSVPEGVSSPSEGTEANSQASIFGDARPVNTASKELEIANKFERPSEPSKRNVVQVSNSDIFGAAKPVDTYSKYMEVDKKEMERSKRSPPSNKKEYHKPTSTDIFGAAKPVDTLAREREIEEKMYQSSNSDGYSQNNPIKIPPKGEGRKIQPRDSYFRGSGAKDRDNYDDRRQEPQRNGRSDRNGINDDYSNARVDSNARVEEREEQEVTERPEGYNSDEERFLKAQPKSGDEASSTLDMTNKFGNLDLELEI